MKHYQLKTTTTKSTVMQRLDKALFGHPEVREEELKLVTISGKNSLNVWKNWESIRHGETKTLWLFN